MIVLHRDALAAYARIWAVQRSLDVVLGGNQALFEASDHAGLEAFLFALLLMVVGITGSVRAQLVAAVCIAATTFVKAPYIWDCDFWLMLTDLSLLLVFCSMRKSLMSEPTADERAELFASASELIRAQMGIFYFAAGFWKLNSSFLSPHHSCAPVFMLQLVADLLTPSGVAIPDLVAYALGQSAPLLILVGELALGALLLQPRQPMRRLGVALALLFHAAVALCPPPNNVSVFSMLCASRLLLYLPIGFPAAAAELSSLLSSTSDALRAYYAASGVGVALAAVWGAHPDFFDWGLPLYAGLGAFVCRALALDHAPSARAAPRGTPPPPDAAPAPAVPAAVRAGVLGLTAFYAFGCLVLGLHDQGQPHMYANLRLHGGSNHLLAPTGLLQAALEHADPRGPLADFSGGVVRVDASTSPSLNAAYPSEYTAQLSPRTRALLRAANHSGRMWNPMLTLITPSEAPWSAESGEPFTKYTMPALELRRFLHELRRAGEAFELTYTRLDAAEDARLRPSTATGTTVRLREDGSGGRSCTVLGGGALASLLGSPCAPDELALLPPPSALARKLLLFEPYPIIAGDEEEVHCFGP